MSSSVLNSRGQLQTIVDISVEEGEKREATFKEYMMDKKGVDLVKKGKYKHYDFYPPYDKTLKVEFKSVNASVNTYTNVLIGCDKISYYLYRKIRQPDYRFFLVYGFYDVDDRSKTLRVHYKYCEVDLEKFVKDYGRKVCHNKKHLFVPVNTLKPLKGLVDILKQSVVQVILQ